MQCSDDGPIAAAKQTPSAAHSAALVDLEVQRSAGQAHLGGKGNAGMLVEAEVGIEPAYTELQSAA